MTRQCYKEIQPTWNLVSQWANEPGKNELGAPAPALAPNQNKTWSVALCPTNGADPGQKAGALCASELAIVDEIAAKPKLASILHGLDRPWARVLVSPEHALPLAESHSELPATFCLPL